MFTTSIPILGPTLSRDGLNGPAGSSSNEYLLVGWTICTLAARLVISLTSLRTGGPHPL